MPKVDGKAIYANCYSRQKFDADKYCPLIIEVMADANKGTVSAFCVEVGISENTFYSWLDKNEEFSVCYGIGKVYAKENWEKQGREIYDEVMMPGASNNKLEVWRMNGWSKFRVGKNASIRLKLDPKSNPQEHYSQLIKQASEGEFTAGEIKQLVEAINVGLNAHQVFALQKEIDELKSNLSTMKENSNVQNTFSDKRTTEKD